jgi:integrase
MGVYKREDSNYYWMCYTVDRRQERRSTKTTSKTVATRIWKQREAEIALGLFNVGWPGERVTFEELCDEFEKAHVSCLSDSSKQAFENHRKHLARFFGGHRLAEIDSQMIDNYKNDRRQHRTRNNPDRTVKGATVNRELETLQCMLKMAVRRKYIPANPASGVDHFPEFRERPRKRRITPDEFLRILRAAPVHLRVGITLLEQTGNRTYSELFSLRWQDIDLDAGLICLGGPLKTEESDSPEPLSTLAGKVLRWWKEQINGMSQFVFPSPRDPKKPIGTVKTAWRNTLRRAGISHFPIYQLRHAFCTRVSQVAPDAVIQKAMRHSSPETKRVYQLGMVEEVRQAMEHGNERFYGNLEYHVFSTVTSKGRQPIKKKSSQITGT